MLLIGQFISPFVRRVGIALNLSGAPFVHRSWSTFGDAERIHRYNPGLRVPVLVLDDGVALTDSTLILEHLDTMVPRDRRLQPVDPALTVASLAMRGLANTLAEKAVALVYHQRMNGSEPSDWHARCMRQMVGALGALGANTRMRDASPYLFEDRVTHADIAVATAFRFATDAHDIELGDPGYAALRRHSDAMEALSAFRACTHQHMVPHITGPAAPTMR